MGGAPPELPPPHAPSSASVASAVPRRNLFTRLSAPNPERERVTDP